MKRKGLIAIAISAVILIAALGTVFSPTFIGGSVWQFDYEWSHLEVNGKTQEAAIYPGTIEKPVVDFSSDRFIFFVVPMMDVRTAYEWWVDIDGDPNYSGQKWLGLLPDIGVTTSLPWRVDKNGNKIEYGYDDPLQITHELADETVYEYYYEFNVMAKTKQSAFTVPGTLQTLWQPWISYEAGVMEIDAIITVVMQTSLFSNITGEFADAKVSAVDIIDMRLDSELLWVITPKVDIKQDVNQGIPISNRDSGDDYYSCDLLISQTLTPGLVKSGANNSPYDVYCTKTIRMTLLLKEPLDIGSQGDEQEGLDPPWFNRIDPLALALIFLGIVVIIIIILVGLKYLVKRK